MVGEGDSFLFEGVRSDSQICCKVPVIAKDYGNLPVLRG